MGVCLPAGEIERFACARISESAWDKLLPEQDEELKQFYKVWRNMDSRTQIEYLAEVVQEVVFDPDAETVEVTLVDSPAEKISILS